MNIDYTNKILFFVVAAIVIIIVFVYVKNNGMGDFNQCQSNCNDSAEACEQAYTNINGGNGCGISCELETQLCLNNCYRPTM